MFYMPITATCTKAHLTHKKRIKVTFKLTKIVL